MLGLENAVLNNRPKQIRLLLNLGVNINSKNEDGKTPLMICCEMDNETQARKMAKFLHKLGARLDLRDKHQYNVLMIAVLKKKPLIVDYIVSKCAEFDLNAYDLDKNTALHLAVKLGHTSIVKSIVKAMEKFRLELSMHNDMGLTPLVLSIINRHEDIELYLRHIQSSKNIPSEYPLFVAEPKAKRNCKVFSQPHVYKSSVSELSNKSFNTRERLNVNIQGGKLYRNTWCSDTNMLNTVKPTSRLVTKLVPKKLITYCNTKIAGPTTLSKLKRSKTAPEFAPKKPDDNGKHPSSIGDFECDIGENDSDNGIIQSQSTWTLPKIFDLWQSQLSVSYVSSALPKYEIDENGRDTQPGSDRADSVSSSLFPRTPSCFRGRSVMGTRPVTPFVDTTNSATLDTLALPLEPVRMKSAGRLGSESRVSQLKVTSDRRSRSASPRPIIMVESA